MVGKLAISRAGHDKGTIYLIIKEEGNNVYLADGVNKTCSAPKKKNRKHIQPIGAGLSGEDLTKLWQNAADADTLVKRCIKIFEERKD